MKPTTHLLIMLLTSVVLTFQSMGQEMKFGKYSPNEIGIEDVPFAPEADAIILEENNIGYFIGSVVYNDIHRRIKILKETGTTYGDIILKYYTGEDGIESIGKIKAQTVNFEGKTTSIIELKKQDFHEIDVGDGWKEIRFTFPNLKEGSIFEYSYTKQDKSIYFLDGWVFQNKLPTLKSVFSISIPSYLDYKFIGQGKNTVQTNPKTKLDGIYRWELTNLAPIKAEPYMNHFSDYLEKIEFQLAGYVTETSSGLDQNIRGYQNVLSTWQELTDLIQEDPKFKSHIKPSAKVSETLDAFGVEEDNLLDRAKNIYYQFIENVEFNGNIGIIPNNTLAINARHPNGTRQDINLTFLAYLRKYGLEAYPVLLSSKGNGRSRLIVFPFADQFNQLIIGLKVGDEIHFLDATSSSMPFGYLPLELHVQSGLIMLNEASDLIDIDLSHRSGIQQFVEFSPTEENELKINTIIRFLDYDAVSASQEIKESGIAVFKSKNFEQIDNPIQVEEKQGVRKSLEIRFSKAEKLTESNLLMVYPFEFLRWSENPFSADSRLFPIDFNYIVNDNFSSKIEIPEGYELDDYPENLSVSLPNGEALFVFQLNIMEGILNLNSNFQLKKTEIDAETYPSLKYFMEIIASKFKEPVIFKKSNILSAKNE